MNKLGIIFISLTLLFLVAFIGVWIYDTACDAEVERQRVIDEHKLLHEEPTIEEYEQILQDYEDILEAQSELLKEQNRMLEKMIDLKTGKLKLT